jgi:hypothetical protein
MTEVKDLSALERVRVNMKGFEELTISLRAESDRASSTTTQNYRRCNLRARMLTIEWCRGGSATGSAGCAVAVSGSSRTGNGEFTWHAQS